MTTTVLFVCAAECGRVADAEIEIAARLDYPRVSVLCEPCNEDQRGADEGGG